MRQYDQDEIKMKEEKESVFGFIQIFYILHRFI